MSWHDLFRIMQEEVGREAAERIGKRAGAELGGTRITIGKTAPITPERIVDVAPGNVRRASEILGISRATAYRHLRPRRIR